MVVNEETHEEGFLKEIKLNDEEGIEKILQDDPVEIDLGTLVIHEEECNFKFYFVIYLSSFL